MRRTWFTILAVAVSLLTTLTPGPSTAGAVTASVRRRCRMRLITLVTLVGALASLLGTGTVRADSVLRLADAEDTHVLPRLAAGLLPGHGALTAR